MRSHTRIRSMVVIGAAATALMLTGCASEEPPRRAGTVEPAEAGQDDPATDGSAGGGEAQSRSEDRLEAAGRELTKQEARAALPSVRVLPAGWSVDPENTMNSDEDDGSSDTVTPERCQVVFDAMETLDEEEPAAKAGVTFTGGMLGPFLGVSISSYAEEVPAEWFAQVLDGLSECPRFTLDDGESKTKFTVSALSFPNLGEESMALRMAAEAEGMPLALDLVAIRNGHNVVSVSQASLGGAASVKPMSKAARATMAALSAD